MTLERYDLVVLGAGSGGVRAARIAAQRGLRVAIAEHSRVGGTCVIRGCVPKKLLMLASQFHDQWADARGFGWQLDAMPQHHWPALVAAVGAEVSRLEAVYQKLLADNGVELLLGQARLAGPGLVQVGERQLLAKRIIIATGARPLRPAIPGAEWAITSDDCFTLRTRPERLLVVGGGFIALEFAGIFQRLGSQVVLAHRGDLPLRGFDEDVRQHLATELTAAGLQCRWGTQPVAIERIDGGVGDFVSAVVSAVVNDVANDVANDVVSAVANDVANDLASFPRLRVALQDATGTIKHEEFDAVLMATGREPATHGLGLTEAGVRLGAAGEVLVDAQSRTHAANIWAVGDCTQRLNLTPVAIREGHAVANAMTDGPALAIDYRNVPQAVFSQPPVSAVGYTEAGARLAFGEVDVYRTQFRPLRATLTGRAERVLMKLVVRRAGQQVVGAHMVGSDAPEIMQGVAIAVNAGLSKAQFDATVGIHPTAAEEFVTLRQAS